MGVAGLVVFTDSLSPSITVAAVIVGGKGVNRQSKFGWKKNVAAMRFAVLNSDSDDTTR